MWFLVLFSAVLLADQITKILVAYYSGAAGSASVDAVHVRWVIKDFFEISYSENKNGMMSLFSKIADENTRYTIFIVSTVVIAVGIMAYLFFAKNKGKWNTFALTLVLAGAFGNLIDRLLTVYVRDFIHIIIFNDFFPFIFNVADIAVVVGSVMLVIGILFVDKDAVFRPNKKDKADAAGKEGNGNEKV